MIQVSTVFYDEENGAGLRGFTDVAPVCADSPVGGTMGMGASKSMVEDISKQGRSPMK